MLCACGNITESSSPAGGVYQRQSNLPQERVSLTSIDGNWKSSCIADLATRMNYTVELSFQDNLLLSRTVNFADENCTVSTTEEERVSKIKLDLADDSHATLNETFFSLKYRPTSNQAMAQLNSDKFCGYSQWSLNQFRVFTDAATCNLNASDLYQIELYGDRELHLMTCKSGDTSDCQTLKLQKSTENTD